MNRQFCVSLESWSGPQSELAILDLMMEEKDSGFVLCHRIKKLYPDTPVMMVIAVKAATGFVVSG